MTKPLRVLMVEDSAQDAELMLLELRQGMSCIEFERVESVEAFCMALDRQSWDVVICDYNLPTFGVLPALALVRQREPYLPFIIVSGAVGEEFVVEAMKLGANDFIVKHNLARLLPAVKRELAANQIRKKRALVENKLRDSEAKYRRLIEQAPYGIFVVDEKLQLVLVNESFCEMTGYGKQELLGRGIADIYPEPNRSLTGDGRVTGANSRYVECMTLCRDGSQILSEIGIRLLENGHRLGMVRDISECRKPATAAH